MLTYDSDFALYMHENSSTPAIHTIPLCSALFRQKLLPGTAKLQLAAVTLRFPHVVPLSGGLAGGVQLRTSLYNFVQV
jgi:hypothetical protein